MIVSTASADYDEIDLISLAQRAWRSRRIVAAVTCLAPIFVFLFIWMQPASYEATATVVILPDTLQPPFNQTGALSLGPLPKEEYQQEAVSDAVLNLLRQKLQGAGIPPSVIDRQRTLLTTAHPTMPWVALTVQASEPTRAQAIANTWAAVLLEVDQRSVVDRKHELIDEIFNRHSKAGDFTGDITADVGFGDGLKAAELVAKQQRAFAVEDEIGRTKATLEDTKARIIEIERQLRDPSLKPVLNFLSEHLSLERGALRGFEAREAALQIQLREAWADIDRLRRELGNPGTALSQSTRQAEQVESPNRSKAEAREEILRLDAAYREAVAARVSPTSYLRIGILATPPSTPQRKSFSGAMLAVPFALLGALAFAAVAALASEVRARRVAATWERHRQ